MITGDIVRRAGKHKQDGVMNCDTDPLVADILMKAGAIENCRFCYDWWISAEDEDAKEMAYGMATNAWKDNERGFRGMEREEVLSLIKGALARTPVGCPRCKR